MADLPTFRLITGDCIEAMAAMPEASVDAIVTDPPYGLEFMGKEWDRLMGQGGTGTTDQGLKSGWSRYTTARPQAYLAGSAAQTWHQAWATEALRVLKPGGHLLAFGGTRTYHRLACAIEDAGFEIRDCLAWMYGSGFPKSLDVSKAIDKAAGAEREVVGSRVTGAAMTAQAGNGATAFGSGQNEVSITAPATPDAQRWHGWGTALKPSHEPVVWATKPVAASDLAARIGSQFEDVEVAAWHAQRAGKPTPTGRGAGSSDSTATSPSASTGPTALSIVTSWRNIWDDLCDATSTFTIGTTSSTTTALQTLSSCLSEITPENITPDPENGWSSPVRSADALLAAIRASTLDTLTLTAIVSATAKGRTSALDAGGLDPAYEPIVLARKPLVGTVAANVQAHGTGALNVDGCRVEGDMPTTGQRPQGNAWGNAGFNGKPSEYEPSAAGRWPANVLLDEQAAAMLDEQTGETRSRSGRPGRAGVPGEGWGIGTQVGTEYDDMGGASRFFYTSKASSAERNRGTAEYGQFEAGEVHRYGAGVGEGLTPEAPVIERNTHPTVKPVDLMQWLCRLITPPGGTVLDPFTGSGSTGIAALREGFEFIGIEREPEYVEIARSRIVGDAPLFNVEADGG